VEEETDREIERNPGQVEIAERAAAGEKAADLVEVAHRLQPNRRAAAERPARDEVENARAQPLVESPRHSCE
jgi:hypothetical protein